MNEIRHKANDNVMVNGVIKFVHETAKFGDLLLVETSSGSHVWLKESELAPDINQTSYEKGRDDTWEIIRKLKRLTSETLLQIFGSYDIYDIVDLYSAAECAEKIAEWENQIEVGDIVEVDGSGTALVLDVRERGSACSLLWSDCNNWYRGKSGLHKTGKHVEI